MYKIFESVGDNTMNEINTIIFDLDGTLLNTLEDLTDAVNHALCVFGYNVRTIDEIRSFVGNGVRKLCIRALPDGESNPDFEPFFAEFKRYYGVHCNDKTAPYAGIIDLMKELKSKGYKMAIVSNKLHSATSDLNEMYFKDYTNAVCGDQEGLERKPAPDSCNKVLKEMGVNKENAIYIGDSEVDLQTARNAGMKCISCLWGFRDKEFLIKNGAEIFADTPSDIMNILM